MSLLCRVDSGIRLPRAGVSTRFVERLIGELSVANPELVRRQRLGKSTWGLPERLYFLEEHGGELRLPRGAVAVLQRLAVEEAVPIAFDDWRVVPGERLPNLPDPDLRDYQAAAVDLLVRATQGVFVLATGAGKTRAALGAVARLRTPTLVLVGSRDLAAQWREQVVAVLGQPAGLIAGGVHDPQPITVAVVQALCRWPEHEVEAFLAGFGLLIVDEAHHTPVDLFRRIVDRCPAKYRLGLTATPEREDGLGPLVELFLGPTLVEVSHAELAAAGHLLVPTIRVLETGFDYPYTGARDWAPMLDALVTDGRRNRQIVATVATEARAGQSCLVLSGRKDHCALLVDALGAAGVHAAALTSDVPKQRRVHLLAEARAGRLPVLVATSLADEGLDLPILSRVFLTYPSKAQGRTIQRLGRILRPHPAKKDAVVIDVVDARVSVLRRHAAARRRAYARVLGIESNRREAA